MEVSSLFLSSEPRLLRRGYNRKEDVTASKYLERSMTQQVKMGQLMASALWDNKENADRNAGNAKNKLNCTSAIVL